MYSRQTILPQLGVEGQARLKASRVLCVGAGGLGSPVLMYLAAAGIGRIGIIDADRVDASNLHRQILFGTRGLGNLKAEEARARLNDLNPAAEIVTFPVRLDPANALNVMREYDVIVDGTDNFPSKFLINDAAVKLGLPVVYGSVSGFEAQVGVFWATQGPCYRCLYPAPPAGRVQNCAEAGVLGSVAGIAGTLQATEAIKLALRDHPAAAGLRPMIGRLLVIDAARMAFSSYAVPKRPECRVCGVHPDLIRLEDDAAACEISAPRSAEEVTSEELLTSFRGVAVVDVRSPDEWRRGHI